MAPDSRHFYIIADFHTHTTYSHGKGSVEDNVRAGRERGLRFVGIADHGPANLFGIGVKDLDAYQDIRREAERCNLKYGDVEALTCAEANIITRDGDLDVPLAVARNLDVVLAGLHVMIRGKTASDSWVLAGRNFIARYSRWLRRRARVDNTKAVIEAVMKNPIDVITHPDFGVSIDTEELASACARTGAALEINARHASSSEDFIKTAAKQGVLFCVGSDAHCPEEVGDLECALHAAARSGLASDRIVNSAETFGERKVNWRNKWWKKVDL
ncbi:MAG: PHP domain-containing protein [Firmicutes bacterium]|nr:PHP domain-containing protein [Bacillota bacterium]